MTKREYLRSLGFNVGERGRFTEAMKHAIESYDGTFDEPVSNNARKSGEYSVWIPTSNVPVRQSYAMVGYTKWNTEVQFTGCRRCSGHMMYCICPDGVVAPSMVVRSDDPSVCVSPNPEYV